MNYQFLDLPTGTGYSYSGVVNPVGELLFIMPTAVFAWMEQGSNNSEVCHVNNKFHKLLAGYCNKRVDDLQLVPRNESSSYDTYIREGKALDARSRNRKYRVKVLGDSNVYFVQDRKTV